jgi:hypothetical protein
MRASAPRGKGCARLVSHRRRMFLGLMPDMRANAFCVRP